jgi:hypothetical protein
MDSSRFEAIRVVRSTICVALLACAGVAAPAEAATVTETFVYTGGAQTWTVPHGLTSAIFDVYGAAGADVSPAGGAGGAGGRATATLPLAPGETLQIYVGGAGSNLSGDGGFNGGGTSTAVLGHGGGGGGASDIRQGGTALANRVLVAGGGGGGGNCAPGAAVEANGGAGGGAGGGDGTASCNVASGTGGGQSSGGSGVPGIGSDGDSCEIALLPGIPSLTVASGAGGGGGWYGGGGGGCNTGTAQSGPGGGGSGHGPAGTAFPTSARPGNGLVTITYAASVLTVATDGSGGGFVDSAPAGVDCGSATGHTDCSETYGDGTSVTLKAHPDANSDLAGWSGGGCSGTAPACTVTVDQARSVTATFSLRRALKVATDGTGVGFVDSAPAGIDCGQGATGHADCANDYAEGTSVALTAHPDATTDFGGWSGGGCSGTAGTCTVAMTQARSVTATFTAKPPAPKPQTSDDVPTTPNVPATPNAPDDPFLVLSHRRTRLSGDSSLVTLICRGITSQACNGRVLLRATGKSSRLEPSGQVASTGFAIAGGNRKSLLLPVPATSLRRVERTGKAVVAAVITMADGSTRQVHLTLFAAGRPR